MKIAICIILSALLTGCTMLARPNLSADGLGASNPGDVFLLARMATDELARRYPPAHTHLALARVPGTFGEALETDLRSRGYAVADNVAGALAVQYTVDALDELDSNFIGEFGRSAYVRVKVSDGQEFSFVRKLGAMLPVTPVEPLTQLAPPSKADLTPEKEITEWQSSTLPSVSPIPAPVAPDSQVHPVKTAKGTPTNLANGVLTSLPSNWRYTIPDSTRRSVEVNKPRLPWRESIQSMAEQAGCAASFDENARRVTIIAYDDAPVPQESQTASSASSASIPAPFSQATTLPLSPSSSAVVASALHDVADQPSPMTKPNTMTVVESKPSAEQWEVSPGSLFTQLISWCDRADYQLIWKASHDLDMEAHAIFRGSFTEAIDRLFKGLHKSGNPLRVTLYTANSVMEISEE